jgi:soluble lytic murein transglycosylase
MQNRKFTPEKLIPSHPVRFGRIALFVCLMGFLAGWLSLAANRADAELRAESWVVKELPGGPKKVPKDLAAAFQALAEGAYEDASSRAESFIQQNSEASLALWRMRARVIAARANLELERPKETLRLLEEKRDYPPDLRGHVLFLKAQALEHLGRFREAAELYSSIPAVEPGPKSSPEAVSLAAMSLAAASQAWFQAEDCSKAVVAARALESNHPGHPEIPKAMMLQGQCLEKQDQPEEAVLVYHRLWLHHSLEAAATQARQRLEDLQERGFRPPTPTTEELLQRARTLQKAVRVSEASRAWRALLKRTVSSQIRREATFHLGLDLYFMRKNSEAVQRLRWVADRKRSSTWGPKALYYLSRVSLRLKDKAGFRKTGKELLTSFPRHAWARQFLYLRARVVEDSGRWKEALGQYGRLAKKHPGTRQGDLARWRIGWIHFRRKEFKKAEGSFAKLAKGKANTDVRQAASFWAGRAAEKDGQSSGASHYQAAARLNRVSYYGHMAAERLGTPAISTDGLGPTPPFLKRPILNERSEKYAQKAGELMLAGLFQAGSDILKDGGLSTPYFVYQRARLLHRARDFKGALRLLQGSGFWRAKIGASSSSAEFWQILYPFDRRAMGADPENTEGVRPDPLLVSSVILAESLYDPDALSVAGARGLMQLMPKTGQRIARRLGIPSPSPDDLFRPDLNVRLGTNFLGTLLAHFGGQVAPAVAAYNAGLKVAEKWWGKNGHLDEASFIATISYRETRRYVRRVLGYYRQYQATYRQRSSPPHPLLEIAP